MEIKSNRGAKTFLRKVGIGPEECERLYALRRETGWRTPLEKFERDLAEELAHRFWDDYYVRLVSAGRHTINTYGELVERFDQEIERAKSSWEKAVQKNAELETEVTVGREKYVVTVPKTVEELIAEGYMMRNCLRNRLPWILSGEMKVYFIRRASEPGMPLVDVVLDEDDKIIWAVTDLHETVKGETRRAVNGWYKEVFGHTPGKADRADAIKWM